MTSFRIHNPECLRVIPETDPESDVSLNLQKISDYFNAKHVFTNDLSKFQLSLVGTNPSYYNDLEYVIIRNYLSEIPLRLDQINAIIIILRNSDLNTSLIQHLVPGNYLYDTATSYIKSLIYKINKLIPSVYNTDTTGIHMLSFIDIVKTDHITFGMTEELAVRAVIDLGGDTTEDDIINFIRSIVTNINIIDHFHKLGYGYISWEPSSSFSNANNYISYHDNNQNIQNGIEVFGSSSSTIPYISHNNISLESKDWYNETGVKSDFVTAQNTDVHYYSTNQIILDASFQSGHHIYGGRIHSKTSFLYGVFEITATVPKYHNLFPAIWFYGSDGGVESEIDIMETRGDQTFFMSSIVANNFAYKTQTDNNIPDSKKKIEFGQTLNQMIAAKSVVQHKYVCYWTDKQVTFWLDPNITDTGSSLSISGKNISYSQSNVSSDAYNNIVSALIHPKVLVFNIAATGDPVDHSVDGSKMIINKIKYYQIHV